MPRTIARFLLVLALAVIQGGSYLGAQAPTPSLLGRWHGTSICTRESWNSACNDEENFYEFVPAPSGPPRILVHAAKRAGTAIVSMGDQELLPDSGVARWAGEFSNRRVHIRIVYQVSDSGLTGAVIELPSMQVSRRMRAQRDSSWERPRD